MARHPYRIKRWNKMLWDSFFPYITWARRAIIVKNLLCIPFFENSTTHITITEGIKVLDNMKEEVEKLENVEESPAQLNCKTSKYNGLKRHIDYIYEFIVTTSKRQIFSHICITNFGHEFFSVWAVEKENKFLIGFFSQFASWKTNIR